MRQSCGISHSHSRSPHLLFQYMSERSTPPAREAMRRRLCVCAASSRAYITSRDAERLTNRKADGLPRQFTYDSGREPIRAVRCRQLWKRPGVSGERLKRSPQELKTRAGGSRVWIHPGSYSGDAQRCSQLTTWRQPGRTKCGPLAASRCKLAANVAKTSGTTGFVCNRSGLPNRAA